MAAAAVVQQRQRVPTLGPDSSSPLALIFERVVLGAVLPRAATCFHQMTVPLTTDQEKMHELIAVAVAHYIRMPLGRLFVFPLVSNQIKSRSSRMPVARCSWIYILIKKIT